VVVGAGSGGSTGSGIGAGDVGSAGGVYGSGRGETGSIAKHLIGAIGGVPGEGLD
jgi:hypothetical protein